MAARTEVTLSFDEEEYGLLVAALREATRLPGVMDLLSRVLIEKEARDRFLNYLREPAHVKPEPVSAVEHHEVPK